jgi:hypothetical protein
MLCGYIPASPAYGTTDYYLQNGTCPQIISLDHSIIPEISFQGRPRVQVTDEGYGHVCGSAFVLRHQFQVLESTDVNVADLCSFLWWYSSDWICERVEICVLKLRMGVIRKSDPKLGIYASSEESLQ